VAQQKNIKNFVAGDTFELVIRYRAGDPLAVVDMSAWTGVLALSWGTTYLEVVPTLTSDGYYRATVPATVTETWTQEYSVNYQAKVTQPDNTVKTFVIGYISVIPEVQQ